jgi:hypothetical protein
MKNPDDLMGNGTHVLPALGALRQSTALPRDTDSPDEQLI